MRVEVEMRGAQELSKESILFPKVFNKVGAEVSEKVGERLVEELRAELKRPKKSGMPTIATGNLYRSPKVMPQHSMKKVTVAFGDERSPYAQYVEWGVKRPGKGGRPKLKKGASGKWSVPKGKRVSTRPILKWMIAKGVTDNSGKGIISAAYAISRSISVKGVPAQHTAAKALRKLSKDIDSYLPGYVDKALKIT
jgi:hypothetical protein